MQVAIGDKREVELGGLRFVVVQRRVGDDGGTSIEVYGAAGGRTRQVLRFDCFGKQPHYHCPPGGSEGPADRLVTLDPREVGDGVDWALEQTRHHLPEQIREAGFADLADALDPADFEAGWERIRDAVRAAPAPSKSFEVEVPTEAGA